MSSLGVVLLQGEVRQCREAERGGFVGLLLRKQTGALIYLFILIEGNMQKSVHKYFKGALFFLKSEWKQKQTSV